MGLASNFDQPTNYGVVATQHTDLIFTVNAVDTSNNVFASNQFSKAEYIIADADDVPIIKKDLFIGIVRDGNGLRITVPGNEMNFYGSYQHQLVLFNLAGDKITPIFNEPLTINESLDVDGYPSTPDSEDLAQQLLDALGTSSTYDIQVDINDNEPGKVVSTDSLNVVRGRLDDVETEQGTQNSDITNNTNNLVLLDGRISSVEATQGSYADVLQAVTDSAASVTKASQWAEHPHLTDIPDEAPGTYSSKSHATDSGISAGQASASAVSANNSAIASETSRIASEVARTGSEAAETNAGNHESNASDFADLAGQFAIHPFETDVPGQVAGTYSAFSWAERARLHAVDAQGAVSALTNGVYIAGNYDASTNTPPAVPGINAAQYFITAAGVINATQYEIGDYITYDPVSTTWRKTNNQVAPVNSVNGNTGTVVLNAAHVGAREDTWVPDWNEITNRPSSFDSAAHTHLWVDITDKPVTFTPSPHTHLWADITDKPVTFDPSAHTHLWADITDKPATFPATAHTHLWADITDKPTTFPPSAHNHDSDYKDINWFPTYAEVTGKPTEFSPSAHTHSISEITNLQQTIEDEVATALAISLIG